MRLKTSPPCSSVNPGTIKAQPFGSIAESSFFLHGFLVCSHISKVSEVVVQHYIKHPPHSTRTMEKSPMPTVPQAGYIPQRPCSATADIDTPLPSPPESQQQYTRQNPCALPQESPDEDALDTRGGRGGCCSGLLQVLCAACCCYTFAEICC